MEPQSFRRAAGEVVMIVVGVLIALAASDWQERRSERLSERDMLVELRTALDADIALLERQVERYERIERRVSRLLDIMASRTPYADSLDGYFGTLYGIDGPNLNTAGYESLKSQGLDLISDDELRSEIATVYERAYAHLQNVISAESAVILDLLRPYVLRNFKDLDFNDSATPLDYAMLIRDPYFLNLTDYRLQLVKQNHLPQLALAIPQLRDLRDAIDAELGAG